MYLYKRVYSAIKYLYSAFLVAWLEPKQFTLKLYYCIGQFRPVLNNREALFLSWRDCFPSHGETDHIPLHRFTSYEMDSKPHLYP